MSKRVHWSGDKGFSAFEGLIVILIIITLVSAGYYVKKVHQAAKNNQNSSQSSNATSNSTFMYSDYPYPAMPSDFSQMTKTIFSGTDAVSYIVSTSLSTTEAELTSICQQHQYSSGGGFSTSIIGSQNGSSQTYYEMSCDNKTNNWQFAVTPISAGGSTFKVWVISGPVIMN
jgi:hypothetical protein